MSSIGTASGRAIRYYRANGAKRSLGRAWEKLGRDPSALPAVNCALPPQAIGLPLRRVENRAGTRRLSLVIPSVQHQHLFAGSWTALKIFWEAAKAHHFRPRIICSDTAYNPEALRDLEFISVQELAGIESWHRPGGGYCEVEDDEVFIATAWWTAYALKRLELTHKVFYLVQDFEPSFYPWSQEFLLARDTYNLKFFKVVNTSILYDYLKERGHLESGEAVSFEPGINTDLYYPGEARNYSRSGRAEIILYGRPSVPRNLFSLVCLSLKHFLATYPAYREKVDRIISVGERHADLTVDNFRITSRGKMNLREWARLARTSDIGISLMSSPHPSYIPLEMAASGMVVVSNNMYNKDLSKINTNFVTSEPRMEEIAGCIKKAVDMLERQDEIAANAGRFVSAGRDWNGNLRQVCEFIGGGV